MATMNPIMPSNILDLDQKQQALAQSQSQTHQVQPQSPGVLNSVPAWGSYLYQNFLLPAFSPSEWLNTNTPGGLNLSNDYFGAQPTSSASTSSSYLSSVMPSRTSSSQPYSQSQSTNPSSYLSQQQQHGPSQYYFQQQPPSAIPTSLLQSRPSHPNTQSVEVIDRLIQSPSPIHSTHITPLPSPKRGAKRRASSMDSADSHEDDDLPNDDHDHDHEIAEGVERDGMIWGMKVEDYRALSARERKRVRNRISARTFRAKRKEHLSTLETDLSSKDLQIRAANDEASRLRKQVADLTARLSRYEKV